MAAWVLSAFQDRSASVMLTLYKSIVRPIMAKCRNWKMLRGLLPGGFWGAKISHTIGSAEKATSNVTSEKAREVLHHSCMEDFERPSPK